MPPMDTVLRIRHAGRGSAEERVALGTFLSRCQPYFASAGGMIDQAYQSRLPDGMVRCYVVDDRVAGFGEQLVNALYPAAPGAPVSEAPQPGPRQSPAPIRPPPLTVPAQHGFGLHNEHRGSPANEPPTCQNPETTVPIHEVWPWLASVQDPQLLPEAKIVCDQQRFWLDGCCNRPQQTAKH